MLKRLSLIFLYCLCLTTVYADTHKQRMIDLINSKEYEQAARELPLVDDWIFDPEDERMYMNVSAGVDLLQYVDTLDIYTSEKDSLFKFLGCVCRGYGKYFMKQEEYKTAIPFLELSESIFAIVPGKTHPYYASILDELLISYRRTGDRTKEASVFLKLLELRKNDFLETTPDYTTFLDSLEIVKYDHLSQDYSLAEDFFLDVLNRMKLILGGNSQDYANLLFDIGKLHKNAANEAIRYEEKSWGWHLYERALLYYFEALNITQSLSQRTNQHILASILLRIGGIYEKTGDYVNAEISYNKALDVIKKMPQNNKSNYGESLIYLAPFFELKGEQIKADSCFKEGMNMLKMDMNDFHYRIGDLIFSFQYEMLYEGKYALLLEQENEKIAKSIDGENSEWHLSVLLNIGDYYASEGKYTQADSCYHIVLNAATATPSETGLCYENALLCLGDLYANKIGDYSKAEVYYLKGLELHSFSDFIFIYNLGSTYTKMGNYLKADSCFIEALKLEDDFSYAFGQHDYNTLHQYESIRRHLGYLYTYVGKYSKAEPYVLQVALANRSGFSNRMSFDSEKQLWESWHRGNFNIYFEKEYPRFAYLYHYEKPSIAGFAYDNELFIKGFFLNSSKLLNYRIAESKDTFLINQWNELNRRKQRILYLQQNEPQNQNIKWLQKSLEKRERLIANYGSLSREKQRMWQMPWDSVRDNLSSGQVAIEYMVAPLSEDSTMYCALLLRQNSKYPEMIPLFEEKEVQSLISASSENQIYNHNASGTQISSLVWSKVLPRIKKGETVYFAPSGLLHQLAIESLPFDSTHTMGDMYNLIRLSSTREIVLNKSAENHTTATLYGGIQYDVDTEELLAESEAYSTKHLLASRGIEADTLNRGLVNYLAGTKTEVENINRMLKQNHLQVQLFTATNANEESFKALSGTRQNILHIATHGFFWSDSTAQKKDYFAERMMLLDDKKPAGLIIDPLNRCGLLFAGANLALQGHSNELPEGVQDGILTAKEISLLDLRDADLVVLSACETGKGEITGDGVFGLQRAFKQAGAQTIIMSLWPVNDAATQMLMTEFYRNWITLNQAKRTAFRNAQNAVRAQYNEPIYWAGFIMLD